MHRKQYRILILLLIACSGFTGKLLAQCATDPSIHMQINEMQYANSPGNSSLTNFIELKGPAGQSLNCFYLVKFDTNCTVTGTVYLGTNQTGDKAAVKILRARGGDRPLHRFDLRDPRHHEVRPRLAAQRLDDIDRQLAEPAILGQPQELQRLNKERAELRAHGELYTEFLALIKQATEAEEMLEDPRSGAEMKDLARDELRSTSCSIVQMNFCCGESQKPCSCILTPSSLSSLKLYGIRTMRTLPGEGADRQLFY